MKPPIDLSQLTDQQRIIAQLIASGHTDDEIASRLGVDRGAVFAEVEQLHDHCEANMRVQLAVLINLAGGQAAVSQI